MTRKIKASKIKNVFHQLLKRGFQSSISDKFLLFKNTPFHIFQQFLINIILHALHCVLSNFLYILVIVYQKIRSNPAATRGESPSLHSTGIISGRSTLGLPCSSRPAWILQTHCHFGDDQLFSPQAKQLAESQARNLASTKRKNNLASIAGMKPMQT